MARFLRRSDRRRRRVVSPRIRRDGIAVRSCVLEGTENFLSSHRDLPGSSSLCSRRNCPLQSRHLWFAVRNGYHFWTPVPSDYPNLTFSLDYMRTNWWVLTHTAFPIFSGIALLAWIIGRMTPRKNALAATRQRLLQLVFFVVLTAGPIVAFHLVYFFPTDRFQLPLLAGTAVIAGCIVALLFAERWLSLFKLVLPILLLIAIAYRFTTPEPSPARRLAADEIRQRTPANAIVISAIDPVYLERMAAAGSERRIVPLSRRVEYASKLLAPRRIDHPNPPPANWPAHR